MKILVLGGTGAMGTPLIKLLSERGGELVVTSRKEHQSSKNVQYIKGNAQNASFIKSLLKETKFDAIVDFMVYSSIKFRRRLPLFLENTKQYIFFSSCRVFANSDSKIVEDSVRLLDDCPSKMYKMTFEYALEKAREENLFFKSKSKNWTIIRPYITYNTYRMQLGVFEKENWLLRAMKGKPVVMPNDIAQHYTTMTCGEDVAKCLVQLIGNKNALGQSFNITNGEKILWKDVLKIYQQAFFEETKKQLPVQFIENSKGLQKFSNSAQIKYDRLYDRIFDNSKIAEIMGNDFKFKSAEEGLSTSLKEFLKNPKWKNINKCQEFWMNRNISRNHQKTSNEQ